MHPFLIFFLSRLHEILDNVADMFEVGGESDDLARATAILTSAPASRLRPHMTSPAAPARANASAAACPMPCVLPVTMYTQPANGFSDTRYSFIPEPTSAAALANAQAHSSAEAESSIEAMCRPLGPMSTRSSNSSPIASAVAVLTRPTFNTNRSFNLTEPFVKPRSNVRDGSKADDFF